MHEESTGIADRVLEKYILPNGDNLVYPKVGGEPDGIVQIIESLKANGYSVSLVLNDLPVEKALQRSIGRFQKTGRLVSPKIITDCGYGPIETYNLIKERGLCDGYEVYSNDVGFGEAPILCEKCRGRRTDKVDGRRREKVEGNRESGSGSEFRGTAENQRSTGEAETEGRAVGDTSAGIQAAASALEARGVIGSEQKAENAVKNSVRRIAKSAADIVGDKGDTAPLILHSILIQIW